MKDGMEVGDRVFVEGRRHKQRSGWFSANGVIEEAYFDPDFDIAEVVVRFEDDDVETFFIEDFEWTDSLGGHWYKP